MFPWLGRARRSRVALVRVAGRAAGRVPLLSPVVGLSAPLAVAVHDCCRLDLARCSAWTRTAKEEAALLGGIEANTADPGGAGSSFASAVDPAEGPGTSTMLTQKRRRPHRRPRVRRRSAQVVCSATTGGLLMHLGGPYGQAGCPDRHGLPGQAVSGGSSPPAGSRWCLPQLSRDGAEAGSRQAGAGSVGGALGGCSVGPPSGRLSAAAAAPTVQADAHGAEHRHTVPRQVRTALAAAPRARRGPRQRWRRRGQSDSNRLQPTPAPRGWCSSQVLWLLGVSRRRPRPRPSTGVAQAAEHRH